MAFLADVLRGQLLTLDRGGKMTVPLMQKTSLMWQMQDLKMFHQRHFKTTTDKTRHEIVVTRVE